MAANPSIQLGTDGNWAIKEDNLLAYKKDGDRFFNKEFDFTRNTTATFVDKDGLIKQSATNTPRIDFTNNPKGHLLLEPQRQNEVSTSDHNPNSYWNMQGATFTNSSNTTTPDGGLTAPILTTDTTGTFKGIVKNQSSAWNSDTYTLSVFAKNIDSDYIFFYNINSVSGTSGVWFNISNGTIGHNQGDWSNVKVENYGNGWYRCSATVTFNSSGTSYLYVLNSDSNASNISTAGKQTYLWGSQIEQGSYATSYIPTYGSSATRNAEVCNNSGSVQDFNDNEGVLYTEIASLVESDASRSISISNASNWTKRLQIVLYSSGDIYAYINNGVVSRVLSTSVDYGTNMNKIALRYTTTSVDLYINGVLAHSHSANYSFASNTLNVLDFKIRSTNGENFYGKTKNLKVFKRAMSDGELYLLTVPQYQSYQEMATALNYTL